MNLRQFFQQQQIKFGTSGIRANNSALTDQACYVSTLAFLQYLEQKNWLAPGGKIALAGDLRANTDKITRCILQCLADHGFIGIYLGKIPTPALSYYCEQQACPGLMITGSHIEANMNGIKFYLACGEILKDDEQMILDQPIEVSEARFTPQGQFKNKVSPLPPLETLGESLYLKRYLDFFQPEALKGMRLGVYQHSAVASPILAKLLESLGASIIPFGQALEFQSIDTEALTPAVIQLARDQAQSLRLDAIVSTDGDGDRPLIADETGKWLRGDLIGMLCAITLKAEYLVVPITCNSSVDKLPFIKQLIRTRVGSPYVIEGIMQLLSQHQKNILGYEANGGVLVGTPFTQGTHRLSALATRDGILPSLCLLAEINKTQTPLSTFASQYQSSFTASSSIKDFSAEEFGWFNQGSGEQAQLIQNLEALSHPPSPLKHIGHIDGLRLSFENGDIIHLRCSGNAPELRCYTESNSETKALKLNADCCKLLASIRERQHAQIS